MEVTGLAARAAALRLLDGVLTDGRPLADLLLPEGPLQRETPDTRARGQRLALATLRNVDRADAVLKPFLRRNPIPPVRNALRLAVVEMLGEGAPAHGVVNATVALLGKSEKTSGHAGLANAVLRKAAEAQEIWDRQPPQRLPGWLRGRLNSAWGNRATQAIEAAQAAGAPTDITLKGARPEGLEADVLPTGSLRLSGPGALTAQPGYESGDWWVQDAAAGGERRRLLLARAVVPRGPVLLLAEPITATVFNYGEFGARDTRMAAISLTAMSLGVPAFMLSKVLAPAFYARQDTKTPMRAAIWTVGANVALTVVLTTPLWLYDVPGAHGGIALATALAGVVNAVLLWRYLRQRDIFTPEPGWARYTLRLAGACAAMAVVVLGLRFSIGAWTDIEGALHRIGWLVLVIGAGGATYVVAMAALGLRPRHLRH